MTQSRATAGGDERGGRYAVELFLRADPDPGAEETRQAAVRSLAALADGGAVANYRIHTWGRTIRLDGPLSGTPYHELVLDRVESFREWATRTGASLDGAFGEHLVRSSMADQSFRVLSLPTCCLAVYDDDGLVSVYPHQADGRRHDLGTALERLGDDGDRPARGEVLGERTATDGPETPETPGTPG